ncbi:MAG: methylenetetrahydrofolate reductase [Acidimicrobiales bacterium]
MELTARTGTRPAARPTVARLLARPTFEVYPSGDVAARVEALPPDAIVAVSCSPTRGIDVTLAVAEHLTARGFRAVPHLAARLVADEAHLTGIVGRLTGAGVRDIFVIGGDAPVSAGPFPSTVALLSALARLGHPFRQVGVAAYPDGHPFLDDDVLLATLRAKQRFATYMVTQMCFDAGPILRWLGTVRRHGVDLPVHVGLPGVVTPARLVRIAGRIGVRNSVRLAARHARLVANLAGARGYRPDRLLDALARHGEGIDGLHLYTLNEVAATERWRQRRLGA